MSRINQILIWVTLSIVGVSLTAVYFWPEPPVPIDTADSAPNLGLNETLAVTQMQDLVVTVLNGSKKEGLAKKTQGYLEQQSVYVTRIGNAPNRNYLVSEIIYHPESSQAAYELAKLLNITKRTPATSFESRLFVTVVIGSDFQEPAIASEEE
jgi:thioredoxin-like negative regulator of GroEL